MAHVHEEQQTDVPPDELWGRIGGFLTFDRWHPAIGEVVSKEGGRVRDLHLAEGDGVVTETLLDEGERFYAYSIDESPLPVAADYRARIWVEERDGGSTVLWEADFTPEGASEEEAVEVIRGIFRAGLDTL
jgi:Polyketide cyclase / dehydrase and lipid transport